MTTKNNQSTMKPIRFKNELLDLISRVMADDEKLAPFVHEACKKLAVERLEELAKGSQSKVCRGCGQVVPLANYPTDKNRPGWYGARCKPCTAKASAESYARRKGKK